MICKHIHKLNQNLHFIKTCFQVLCNRALKKYILLFYFISQVKTLLQLISNMERYDILDTSKLTFEGDFEQQVEEILKYVRLSKEEVIELQSLFDDLFNALNRVWSGIHVKAFGSIVTGLGIKSSDVDCYVELPSWLSPPEKSFVFKARNILKQQPWIFQQLLAISNARVPILKLYHVPTNCSCDISFSSSMGVENSKLINYYLNLDRRVLKLAVLVKYWSKIHNITGTNLMPSYCLTMLLIFYLQQNNFLPTVMELQENAEELMVNNWNMAFNSLEYRDLGDKTLYQLLGGFFKFYHTFRFDHYVVSPYIGYPIERELFTNIETVPKEFKLYYKNVKSNKCKPIRLDTAMCVGDPLDHGRNCAVGVHHKLFLYIINMFGTAAYIFDTNDEQSALKKLLFRAVDTSPLPKTKPKQRPPLKGVQKRHIHPKHKNYNQNLKRNNQNPHNIKRQFQRNQQHFR